MPQAAESDLMLSTQLLSEVCIDNEASTPSLKSIPFSPTYSRNSIRELPPPQKQCSFAQATLNGNKTFT